MFTGLLEGFDFFDKFRTIFRPSDASDPASEASGY